MRFLLVAMAVLLPFSASGAVILSNTPDSNKNVIGCYGGNSGNPQVGPCFTGTQLAANNHSSWLGVGWTMGANAYPFQEADVMLISVGFAPCNGCTNQFGGYLYSDNGGVPGNLISSLTPSPSETKGGLPVEYAYTPPSPITLQANTSYWLLLQASYPTFALLAGSDPLTGSGATYLGAFQSSSTPNSNAPIGANPVAASRSNNNTLQPYLVLKVDTGASAAVPEPSAFLLVAGGLAAAALRKLRMRQLS